MGRHKNPTEKGGRLEVKNLSCQELSVQLLASFFKKPKTEVAKWQFTAELKQLLEDVEDRGRNNAEGNSLATLLTKTIESDSPRRIESPPAPGIVIPTIP